MHGDGGPARAARAALAAAAGGGDIPAVLPAASALQERFAPAACPIRWSCPLNRQSLARNARVLGPRAKCAANKEMRHAWADLSEEVRGLGRGRPETPAPPGPKTA